MSARPACGDCGKPMRPQRAKAHLHPGTVAVGAKGLCRTCYSRTLTPSQAQKAAQDHARTESVAASLQAYLQWRAPFRAKAMR